MKGHTLVQRQANMELTRAISWSRFLVRLPLRKERLHNFFQFETHVLYRKDKPLFYLTAMFNDAKSHLKRILRVTNRL